MIAELTIAADVGDRASFGLAHSHAAKWYVSRMPHAES